jgi:hypothetical protein
MPTIPGIRCQANLKMPGGGRGGRRGDPLTVDLFGERAAGPRR